MPGVSTASRLFKKCPSTISLVMFVGITIGVVNKGRHVTLKYFSILIKINKEHRLFMSQQTSGGGFYTGVI